MAITEHTELITVFGTTLFIMSFGMVGRGKLAKFVKIGYFKRRGFMRVF